MGHHSRSRKYFIQRLKMFDILVIKGMCLSTIKIIFVMIQMSPYSMLSSWMLVLEDLGQYCSVHLINSIWSINVMDIFVRAWGNIKEKYCSNWLWIRWYSRLHRWLRMSQKLQRKQVNCVMLQEIKSTQKIQFCAYRVMIQYLKEMRKE